MIETAAGNLNNNNKHTANIATPRDHIPRSVPKEKQN